MLTVLVLVSLYVFGLFLSVGLVWRAFWLALPLALALAIHWLHCGWWAYQLGGFAGLGYGVLAFVEAPLVAGVWSSLGLYAVTSHYSNWRRMVLACSRIVAKL